MESSRGVNLTTHLYLVPWLRISGDKHLLPLYALTASAGKNVQLTQRNKVLLVYLLVSQFVVKRLTWLSSTCSISLSSGVYWARWIQFQPSQTWRFILTLLLQCTSMCMYLPEESVYPDLSTGHGWSAGNCIQSSWLWVQITVFFAVTPTDNFTLHISSHNTSPPLCTIDHTFHFYFIFLKNKKSLLISLSPNPVSIPAGMPIYFLLPSNGV